MFVPVEMSEVDIFVFENDVEAVAQTVAGLGVMHLLDVASLGKWAEGVSTEWTGRVSAYVTQERRVKELLEQLDIAEGQLLCEGRLNPAEDYAALEEEIQEIETEVRDLRQREVEVQRQIEHWDLLTRSMEILEPLSVSISDLRQLEHLHMVAGSIPAENLARLEASLFRIPYNIIPVFRYRGRVVVFAFSAEEHAAILDRALESAFLDPLSLPQEFGGTAQEVLTQVTERARKADEEFADIQQQRQELVERLRPRLLPSLTRIRGDRAIADAMAHFGHRGRVYLIAGWVPKDRVDGLRQVIEETTEGRVTFEENPVTRPDERTKVPTLLRNSSLFRPMEALVTTYGTPGYREIDPTAILGITFVVMFGSMFGDLGHGLVLALVGALLAYSAVPKLGAQTAMGQILIACGISSAVFGLLYGSLFGMEGVIPALWLHPMRDILPLLGASVAFGVVVLNIGFACRLATAMRSGRIREAIFDKNGVVGMLLYWSLLGVVAFVVWGGGVPGWLVLIIVTLVVALFLAEPLTHLITGHGPIVDGSAPELAVQAFFELFEALISYASNTLSYVRLGAFAVAHVGLSMVVFLLADMLGGGIAAILVIILGNIVVIGFEGLIVGIQTLRLEYYELFGKFFKGEGIPFKPLTLPAMECEPRT
jgi:V/A-type H+/Na+-transporting ATPase subunit I